MSKDNHFNRSKNKTELENRETKGSTETLKNEVKRKRINLKPEN